MAGYNEAFKAKIAWIKEQHDCITYAAQVLGWPVRQDGDRYISLAPNSKNPTALILHESNWYDFKTGESGDVIDLCANAKYDGDKGMAIRELSIGYTGADYDSSDWRKKTQDFCNKVEFWHESLRPEDIEYLHSRNINDDTIERLKLGFDKDACRLMIPYFKNGYAIYAAGRDRKPAPEVKYWSDNPEMLEWALEQDADTLQKMIEAGTIKYTAEYEAYLKRSKYQKQALTGYNDNVPWGLHTLTPSSKLSERHKTLCEIFPDAKDTLCILEGAFDVMSFEQEGWFCISPIGGYFSQEAKKLAVTIARQFKQVFICFDSDGPGTRFNLQMAQLMFENRVPFVIGSLPEGIKDVSDYYSGGGDLIELVRNAREGITALATGITDKKEFKEYIYKAARFVDKADLALLFDGLRETERFPKAWLKAVESECSKAPSEKIVVDEILSKYLVKYVEGVGFYIYDRYGYWKFHTDNAVRGIIGDILGVYATGVRMNTILTYLKGATTTQELFNREEAVNFINGILDLKTGELIAHDSQHLFSVQMNYKYEPDAKCPKWRKFIADIMDDNPEKILLIQELAGYILFPDLCLQKCFFLQGEGANGKSVFINVMTQVIGEALCSSVPMSLLASPFDPIRLLNSWVNFMTETDTNIKDAEARFKAIVAGDRISAAYKGKDAIEFNPRCVMVSSCNNYIKTNDTSKGFYRRICFIGFTRTFEGKDANRHLTEELLEELPGIFNWVYEGYKRLKQNMAFTETQENKELLQDFLQIMDPVEAFFNEVIEGLIGIFDSKELYGKYSEWCRTTNHQVQTRQRFTRAFKTHLIAKRPHAQVTRDKSGYVFNLQEPELDPEPEAKPAFDEYGLPLDMNDPFYDDLFNDDDDDNNSDELQGYFSV